MLTVLMATFNGAATLPAVLEAYTHLISPAEGWRLLVVDNGSVDGTRALLQSYAGRLPLQYAYEPRRGKNAALNHGLDLALAGPASRLLVFTDDDARPEPNWLLQLAEATLRQPAHAVFGGAILADWGAAPPAWIGQLVPCGVTYGLTDPQLPEGPVHPGLVWGANMAVRAEVFEAGFRFDEGVGPNRGEYAMGGEVSFTRRLAALGYRAWFCPAARIYHHIRPHQLSRAWVLARARRHGRGAFRQAAPGQFPEWFGMPRWMLRKLLHECAGWLLATLARQAARSFLHRWEIAYIEGFWREAWSAPRRPSAPRVLLTSYSGQLGGMELRLLDEAQFLRRMGCECVLAPRRFAADQRWRTAALEASFELADLRLPGFIEEWRWRRSRRLLALALSAKLLRRAQASLVHVAFCWTTYGASALWLASRCGIPSVVSVHNAFPAEQWSAWHKQLLPQAFGGVRGVYAVSESAMQHFLRLFGAWLAADVKLAVIPNFVNTARFKPSSAARAAGRASLGLAPDMEVLGSVGRLAEQKRPDMLLEVFAAIAARRPAARLVLVGEGPLEAALRARAAQLGLAQRVIFAGFQQHVEQLLPAFDLHVLLSRREGFGIATVEAMACGVPVVASDVPGSRDILGASQAGLLVPPQDVAAVGAAIEALLDDPARRRAMARQGRVEAESRYSEATVRTQLEAFYQGLL